MLNLLLKLLYLFPLALDLHVFLFYSYFLLIYSILLIFWINVCNFVHNILFFRRIQRGSLCNFGNYWGLIWNFIIIIAYLLWGCLVLWSFWGIFFRFEGVCMGVLRFYCYVFCLHLERICNRYFGNFYF